MFRRSAACCARRDSPSRVAGVPHPLRLVERWACSVAQSFAPSAKFCGSWLFVVIPLVLSAVAKATRPALSRTLGETCFVFHCHSEEPACRRQAKRRGICIYPCGNARWTRGARFVTLFARLTLTRRTSSVAHRFAPIANFCRVPHARFLSVGRVFKSPGLRVSNFAFRLWAFVTQTPSAPSVTLARCKFALCHAFGFVL